MKEVIIDSTIEKPITIYRLCQTVRNELRIYRLTVK
jgi:hypothetical protein